MEIERRLDTKSFLFADAGEHRLAYLQNGCIVVVDSSARKIIRINPGESVSLKNLRYHFRDELSLLEQRVCTNLLL